MNQVDDIVPLIFISAFWVTANFAVWVNSEGIRDHLLHIYESSKWREWRFLDIAALRSRVWKWYIRGPVFLFTSLVMLASLWATLSKQP